MARIRLEIPDRLPFTTSLVIRVTDLNYGGHLGNDRLLSYVHEARARFLAERGISELDACGVGMAMVDAAILFKAEGFMGDRVEISVGCWDVSTRSWDFVYRLWMPDRKVLLAEAKTGMVAFDYTRKQVVLIPPGLRSILEAATVSPQS